MNARVFNYVVKGLLILLLSLVLFVYWPGLNGNFNFDDSSHITGNDLIAITDLSFSQLHQVWNSSPFDFPGSRPLSMMTFGLNYLLTGLDPFWFKFTNLLIHLLCGVAIYQFSVLLSMNFIKTHAVSRELREVYGVSLLAAALWLVAPINLTPVLYVVQRMTTLSTFFVLLSLISYMHGRMGLIEGRFRVGIFVCVPVFGLIGFLAKEIAALLPLFIAVIELTVFRMNCANGASKKKLYIILGAFIGMPLIAACVYLLLHPNFPEGGYATRPFTLEQRLLTEARVIWFYIGQILVPHIDVLALHHDGFSLSKSLFEPITTGFSWFGIMLGVTLCLLKMKQYPVISFGILFFIAGHVLESTIIPLELVFEHRNYLPAFGLLYALSFLFFRYYAASRYKLLSIVIVLILFLYPAAITSLRAVEWGDPIRLAILEAIRNPDSARANFAAGKYLVGNLDKSENPEKLYKAAEGFFKQAVSSNDQNADGLFGLIVLDLHVSQQPDSEIVYELKRRLEEYPYSPLNVTTEHFSYLVKWQMSGAYPLEQDYLITIFEAALNNKKMDRYSRSGILNSYRAYYQEVRKDLSVALSYAREAVRYHPERWHYNMKLIRLYGEMGLYDEADEQLSVWESMDAAKLYVDNVKDVRSWLLYKKERSKDDSNT